MNKKKFIIFICAFILLSSIITILTYSFFKDPSVLINDNSNNITHILSYLGLSIIQILFPIIPGEPIEILAGYLFGKINGTIICFICEAIGSIIVVLLVRKLKDKFTSLYYNENKFKKLNKLKQKKYFNIFSLIFILPGTPKDLLCYFAGIGDYDLIPTLLVVTIGRIPAIISSTIAAGYLKDKKIVVSIVIYLITVLICILDLYIYKIIVDKKEKN